MKQPLLSPLLLIEKWIENCMTNVVVLDFVLLSRRRYKNIMLQRSLIENLSENYFFSYLTVGQNDQEFRRKY